MAEEQIIIPSDVASAYDGYWQDVVEHLREIDRLSEDRAVTNMVVEVERDGEMKILQFTHEPMI